MANLEGVREYNRIRRYLEYIYLYGFFSREDFAQANIGSVKDYDYGVKLIRSIFPEAEGAALWKDGRKYLRVQREYALSGKNRMADSYLLYSMDVENELPTLLGIFSCLAEGKKTVDDTCRDTVNVASIGKAPFLDGSCPYYSSYRYYMTVASPVHHFSVDC